MSSSRLIEYLNWLIGVLLYLFLFFASVLVAQKASLRIHNLGHWYVFSKVSIHENVAQSGVARRVEHVLPRVLQQPRSWARLLPSPPHSIELCVMHIKEGICAAACVSRLIDELESREMLRTVRSCHGLKVPIDRLVERAVEVNLQLPPKPFISRLTQNFANLFWLVCLAGQAAHGLAVVEAARNAVLGECVVV